MSTKQIQLPENVELDSFLSTHAHDLRTPYNHITGFSKMLINTIGNAPLDESQKEDLGTIYRSGMRALVMINGLIEIARMNLGEKSGNCAQVNLQSLLDRSILQWNKYHPSIKTQVEIRILASQDTVLVDEMLFQQLIMHSISLTTLFCESQARVTITVEEENADHIFTFTSSGIKTRALPELDLEMFGVINRHILRLHSGQIRRMEELELGGMFQFGIPKNL